MKSIQNSLIVLLLIIFAFPFCVNSQVGSDEGLSFEVQRTYPIMTLSKTQLMEAETLADLSRYYKPSWVREYLSVEITTTNGGIKEKTINKSLELSQEQKDKMLQADPNTEISVFVLYMPENTLSHNDPKKYSFTFLVDPQTDAKYAAGKQKLNEYLKEKAISKIPEGIFVNYDLTAINFTINEEGKVVDAHIFEGLEKTFEDNEIENLLLETICTMPDWEPAEYDNGYKVKQDFVLTVGNHENCIMNLLYIRP